MERKMGRLLLLKEERTGNSVHHDSVYNSNSNRVAILFAGLCWSLLVYGIALSSSSSSRSIVGEPIKHSSTHSGDETSCDKKQKMCKGNHDKNLVQPSAMCKPFLLSPTTIWAQNTDRIHAASRLPEDSDFYNHDLHAALLQLVSPRLPSAVRMVEKHSAKLEVVLMKAYDRYEYLNQPAAVSTTIPPPVNILVMGGSVTRGKYCSVGGHESEIPVEICSWAGRLEKFINTLAGGELVRVHNMARGATDTRIGVVMLQNRLLPASAQQPDIVISAYSTNDQTLKTNGYIDAEEALVREVMNWRPCQESKYQPIMVHFDEYMGGMGAAPIIDLISTTTTHNFDTLARYYGFSYISYADAIRDIVYGDVEEYFFSPKEWFETPGEFHRQLHPGQGMHISSSWMVAYSLLNLATTYCSFESWKVAEGEETMAYAHTKVPGLPQLRASHGKPDGKPRPMPLTVPPSLLSGVDLSTVSKMWRTSASDGMERCNGNVTGSSTCSFRWWWGDYEGVRPVPGRQMRGTENAFKTIVESYGGWYLTYESNKMGWVPPIEEPVGSEFLFRFPKYNETVRFVTVLYMKSYGEGWEGSTVDVRISLSEIDQNNDLDDSRRRTTDIVRTKILGYHDTKTSEVYAERIDLPSYEIHHDSMLRMSIKLLEGEKFKLMGLLVCS